MRLCRVICWRSIRRDFSNISILRSWDTYCRRQDIRKDSDLFIVIREARDVVDVSRWESEERIYKKILVICRILNSVCFKKEWKVATMCWL